MVRTPAWPTQASLEEAYREWLLTEAKREADAGCTRILELKSRLVVLFREVTRGWSPEAVCALMRRRIGRAKYLSISPLETDEGAPPESFRWPVLTWTTPGQPQAVFDYPWRPSFPLDADKVELARLDLRIAQKEFRVPKPLLRKQLRQALKPVMGVPFEASGEARYWTPLSNVTVETDLNLSPGGGGQCEYWHRILPGRVDKANQPGLGGHLLLRCSVSDLLGVHLTEWDGMTEADVPGQAGLLARLVEDFLKAAPGIVNAARERDAASG